MTIRTLLAATALTFTGGAAMAEAHMSMPQSMPFTEVDTNSDEMLDEAELTAAFGADGAAAYLAAHDPDGDGVVTLAEVQAMANVTMSADQAMDSDGMDTETTMTEGEEDDSIPSETMTEDMGDNEDSEPGTNN